MRTTFAFTAALASWTAAVAAVPHGKDEGFIGQQTSAGHNNSATSEFVVLHSPNQDFDLNKTMRILGIENDPNVKVKYLEEVKGAIFSGVGLHCKEALNAMAEIDLVEEKVDVQTFVTQKTGSPWGLQRISNAAGASGSPQGQDFTYSFDEAGNLGEGVDIYVVDTGVRTSNAVFTNKRATQGFTAFDAATDGDGHGTHVAGTAAGAKFGVAQGANIIAVKVLGDDGSGTSSSTIEGMNYVMSRHKERKGQDGFKGSIMSMSWGLQGTAAAVDQVILQASQAGIHVSVAAGNDGADACQSTPSHNGGANSAVVSVGAVNINNEVSEFSNIGSCVDVYAPGEQILSSWNTGDNIINFLSGTSMACPHVSGVMAYLIAQDVENLGQNPTALKAKLLEVARDGAITGNTGGGASKLLSNGVDGGVSAKRLMKNWVVPSHDTEEKRSVTGSPASWARDLVNNLDKRWSLHSTDSPLRY